MPRQDSAQVTGLREGVGKSFLASLVLFVFLSFIWLHFCHKYYNFLLFHFCVDISS